MAISTQPQLNTLGKDALQDYIKAIKTAFNDPSAAAQMMREGIASCQMTSRHLDQTPMADSVKDLCTLAVHEGASAYQQVQDIRHGAAARKPFKP